MQVSAGKRVLMLLENSPYTQDGRVRREANALVAAGYRVTVIGRALPGQRWSEVFDGVRVYQFPAPPEANGFLGYLWEYSYAMAAIFLISLFVFFSEDFDVVHAHCPPDTLVLIGGFYKLLGKRFVYDHHDLSPELYYARFGGEGNRLIYYALLLFEKLACRLADRIIATNQSYKTVEMQRGRIPEERITIVRNGPELKEFKAVEPFPDLQQQGKGKTILGYVGEMGFQDGVDYLLRALNHLVCDLGRTDFFCVLVGAGDAWSQLKALTEQLGLSNNVLFTGWVEYKDVVRYLSAADICVVPDPSNSYNDRSTMIKIMEYMALKKAVVAFDLPEHRFTAQSAAIYVRPNDELEFARALAQLMDDPKRRHEMGRLGRERIETQLAWTYQAEQLLAAYALLTPMPIASVVKQEQGMGAGIMQKIQKLTHWMQQRNPQYIALRLVALLQRYGITSAKARKRTLDCVKFLANHDCYPTFPTPGRVVRQNTAFCQELQDLGSELAVHGYDHIDFHSLSKEEARHQFVRATQAYEQSGIQSEGFRCPYLSYSEELLPAIPDGMFKYSSNKAIWWNVVPMENGNGANAIFDSLSKFYRARSAEATVSTPTITKNVVEIPASLPDDLQLYDGLKLGAQGLAQSWLKMLHQIHRRGEMFVLLFHPESFYCCALAFESILSAAKQLEPAVWLTRLRDVSDWWWEKANFKVELLSDSANSSRLHLHFDCSQRATVLMRNIETSAPTHPWYEDYRVLDSRECQVVATPRPFVGALPGVPADTIAFLREQGYIVETGEQASQCGVHLDVPTVARLNSQVELIAYIESTSAPLVRFWRWPDEHRSALCITGDLDALSLLDYATRLLPW